MALIEFSGCATCSLRHEWSRLANPKMPVKAPLKTAPLRVLVIGEAPGEEEDRRGIPFVGNSGKLLRENIPASWHEKLYWTNIVRCRPKGNATPQPLEVECCTKGFLEADLATIRPQLIIAVGAVALHYFAQGLTISFVRGIAFPVMLPHGETAWVYPILHPSYILQAEERQSKALLPLFISDLAKLFSNIEQYATLPRIPQVPKPKDIVYPHNAAEAWQLFLRLQEPYALDFETFKLRPYLRDARMLTAGFSDGQLTFAVPIEWPGFDWGVNFIAKVGNADKIWVAHGAAMELPWLITYSGNLKQTFCDTMSIARMLHQRTMISSLATLTHLHLGFNIKAITGVKAADIVMASHSLEQTLYYQSLDAWATAQLKLEVDRKLPQNQEDNVLRADAATYSTVLMELNGIDVDLTKSLQLKRKFLGQRELAEKRARLIPEVTRYEGKEGRAFALSAPEQVGHVLVNYCGMTLPATKSGWSTDEDFLGKFKDQIPLVACVLDYREPAKVESTYVDPILNGDVLAADGKLHGAYSTLLTATLRLSSENPNMQNFPNRKNKEVREQVVAPEGYIMAAFDYGQLEARGLAMASRDKNLVKSFVDKEDIHQKWLDRILKVSPSYIHRLASKTGEVEEKAILKAGRTIIKTDFVFASFYGSQIKSVAARTGIAERDCTEVWDEFWREYPGVKKWQEASFAEYANTGGVHNLLGLIRNEMLPGNEPINTPIQSTAAQIVIEAQNALAYRAIRENDFNLLPRINVHDDLIFMLPDNNDLERYIEVIAEEIVKPRFAFQNVSLMTECRIGPNWGKLEAIGKFEGGIFLC